MKTTLSKLRLLMGVAGLGLASMGLLSCNDDDEPVKVAPAAQHFTISAWAQGDDQYIASVPSLHEGSLSFIGKGIEAQGSRYLWHKQYVYQMNLPEKKFIQYEMKADGSIAEKSYILTDGVVPNYFQSLNVIDDNTLLVLGALDDNKGQAGWARISVNDFKVLDKGTFAVPYDAAKPDVAFYLGRGFADNGKFILGGYFYDAATRAYVVDGVKALVYDFPTMGNMKVISTNVTNGSVGYDYLHSVDKDEEGNHYFVVSAGKYWMGNGGKSGVVRIKKGTAEFDKDYFLDVTTPAGEEACLMGLNYVGNGIAFGTVQYESKMTSVRDRYKDIAQVVKLNLNTKAVTVMNSPLSPVGMVRSPLVYNGKYYTGISPVDKEAFIYEFDPAGNADSFKKGISLDGGGYIQVQLIAPHPTR
ncbi:DUF4374 domain-containing protein [Dyadobacter fermentans]|uniref:DUF4374 domain-containing protein n=1 Tax=Dyadobacter fermentans (strain ATCC 700827 / DSM 18053 / CIP 107007 / KCTC 52180 / NS114) TaxID=471854 RepID=C6W194_DYAFD|nr:DUF4374 domain-containing protein [Dyadobacter fermentans]ACT91951.1 hypothetical protein Dfer_0689 [Dyadobacter fermentans DSM 18053]